MAELLPIPQSKFDPAWDAWFDRYTAETGKQPLDDWYAWESWFEENIKRLGTKDGVDG